MKPRVVITGIGVVSPNGIDVPSFEKALRNGESGIRFNEELDELGFGCRVTATPPMTLDQIEETRKEFRLIKVRNNGLIYGVKAGMEAWADAGLDKDKAKDEPLWDTGCVFGAGALSIDACDIAVPLVRSGRIRKVGSRLVLEAMNSGTASYLTSQLGFGNQVTANSSACSTGTEAIIMAYNRIISGQATRMLAGSCETDGPIIWGVFDSIRALQRVYNDTPDKASRPMSASARGFVPGAGAAALVLERYEDAMARGAKIYAEIVGVGLNSGGQRQGGTKTAPNQIGIIRCIQSAIQQAKISPKEIDLISGHLTSTMADSIEIEAWSKALNLKKEEFPYINSIKSMIGHCIGAAGSIECVAALLQMQGNFIHPSLNCEDSHPKIAELVSETSIPREMIYKDINYVIKANFGFGDVNACILFKKI